MTTYRVDLIPDRHGKDEMFFQGRRLGKAREAIFAAARILMAEGADHAATIETGRGETLCLSGKIGDMAKLTVSEPDHGRRFRFAKFVPFGVSRSGQGAEIMGRALPWYRGR